MGRPCCTGVPVRAFTARRRLNQGDVFHDQRWFLPGGPGGPLDVGGKRVGILVGEDLWQDAEHQEPDLLVCLAAWPYQAGAAPRIIQQARRRGRPLVWVNAAGAQDELILDGGSFFLRADGSLGAALPRFQEALAAVDPEGQGPIARWPTGVAELSAALVSGIRGFARKNGLPRAVLGLSGGVDSAVVACLAAEALGPRAVTAVAVPSRYTDPRSTSSARQLASHLGIEFSVCPLEPLHRAAERTLGPLMAGVAAENVQARLRMTILMAHVNARGGMLLNTSNRTELALGYGTSYGDLAGALAPLGDVSKIAVYELAEALQHHIPPFIRERPPSAELRPDQEDPFDYARVAPAVEALLRGQPSGLPALEESDLRQRLQRAEAKRRQGPLVLKVGERSFGSGRLIPITAAPFLGASRPPAGSEPARADGNRWARAPDRPGAGSGEYRVGK